MSTQYPLCALSSIDFAKRVLKTSFAMVADTIASEGGGAGGGPDDADVVTVGPVAQSGEADEMDGTRCLRRRSPQLPPGCVQPHFGAAT